MWSAPAVLVSVILSISLALFWGSDSGDTTAIVLNWSRFPNVVRIVETLCNRSSLHTVVWNNNPQPLFLSVHTEFLWCIVLLMTLPGFRRVELCPRKA